MAALGKRDYLRAIVDMGSNGIRFSISDLSPATARLMPTVYQDRASISLYDAQYSTSVKAPIPDSTIEDVLHALGRFQRTCADFGVRPEHIRVLATEATREAVNSKGFRAAIQAHTGWLVEMLSKEGEGLIGAFGVASSFHEPRGLVMDLGGGSTQLTWIQTMTDGSFETGPGGSISLPFGAAALLRRLEDAERAGNDAVAALKAEVQSRLAEAHDLLGIPFDQHLRDPRGITLYLSGGGFRGWGYILMSQYEISPYPIPIMNGFSVDYAKFTDIDEPLAAAAAAVAETNPTSIFRISARRASQVPAVALLVSCLARAVPTLATVCFAQGGVREGALFQELSPAVRSDHPLEIATRPYAATGSEDLAALLCHAFPQTDDIGLLNLFNEVISTFARLLFAHVGLPQEARAPAGLRCATTGFLAGTSGLRHRDRAALGLLLCARWGNELAPVDLEYLAQLRAIVGRKAAWFSGLFGAFGALVAEVYPAGLPLTTMPRRFTVHTSIKDSVLKVSLVWAREIEPTVFAKAVKVIESTGKKKNWIGGKSGWGMKIDLEQRTENSAV